MSANFGANRLHAFVRFSAEYAGSTAAVTATVTAFLAPANAPSAVLREAQLIKAPDAALMDEWHEVLADLANENPRVPGQEKMVMLYQFAPCRHPTFIHPHMHHAWIVEDRGT
jgi:hypothetical protein